MEQEIANSVRLKSPTVSVVNTTVNVSVVTVVYNAIKDERQEMLLQMMDSVQNQQGLSIEHVIIDGCSNDGTVDLIASYVNKNIPIRFLSKSDQGIYEAMNRGLMLAQGKYVTYLNSDDFYHQQDGLAKSFQILEQTGCDYSFAPVETIGDKQSGNPHRHPWWYIKDAYFHSVFSHQSMLVRRDVMLAEQGFNLSYRSAADYDLVLRLLLGGYHGCYVDYCFVSYRMTGLSSTNIQQSQHETAQVCMHQFNKYLKTNLTEKEAFDIHTKNRFPYRYKWLKYKLRYRARHLFTNMPTIHGLWQSRWLDIKEIILSILSFKWHHLWQFLTVLSNSRFSRSWYLKQYGKEVLPLGIAPAAHYLEHGWRESKDPSPRFSTQRYLTVYPDVVELAICPLIHWKKLGRREGRVC